MTHLANGLSRVAYQLAGSGKKRALAVFDPLLVANIAVWLAERLGPMAWVRKMDEDGMTTGTVNPPQFVRTMPEIPGGYGDLIERFPGMAPSKFGAAIDLLTIRATGETVIVMSGGSMIRASRQAYRQAA